MSFICSRRAAASSSTSCWQPPRAITSCEYFWRRTTTGRLKQLESSFEHVVFFAPADLHRYVDAAAQPYDGPSISTHQLEALEADPPAQRIDPGKINGDFYENAAIGFSYRIPQGWTLEAEGAVQPAVERDRAKENFGRPRVGRTERRLMDACSRTLFSLWARRPAADGLISYDEFWRGDGFRDSARVFPADEVSRQRQRPAEREEFFAPVRFDPPHHRRYARRKNLHHRWQCFPV